MYMGLTVLGSPSDLCACSACENLTVTLSACWLEPDGKIKWFASSHQTESACACMCVCTGAAQLQGKSVHTF